MGELPLPPPPPSAAAAPPPPPKPNAQDEVEQDLFCS